MAGFHVRRDTSVNNIPVVGYQDAVDAQDVILWGAMQVTETGPTDGNGVFRTTRPIVDVSHDWIIDTGGTARERKIDGSDITAKKSDNTPLYVGQADGLGKTVPLFTDENQTTAAANLTGVQVTYWTLVPLAVDSQGRLILAPDPSTKTVQLTGALPAGTNTIGSVQLLDALGNTLAAKNHTSDGHSGVNFPLATVAYGYVYNGLSWDRVRTPYAVKPANLTASGTVWTPPSGKKVNLMKAILNVGKPATAGDLIGIQLTDTGSPISPTFWLAAGGLVTLDFGNGWSTTGDFGVTITGSLADGSSVAVWLEGTVE